MMVNEINEVILELVILFMSKLLITLLILDKNRNVGVVGYDYTINFKNNYKALKEIIDSIDISEIKIFSFR